MWENVLEFPFVEIPSYSGGNDRFMTVYIRAVRESVNRIMFY